MTHEVKQPLRLVGGKFMRGNVEEAPEIGNREQIELLQSYERKVVERERQSKEEGLDVEIRAEDICYDAVCEFTCICGEEVKDEVYSCMADDYEDLEEPDDFDGDIITCKACGRQYEIDGCHAKLLTI